MPCHSCTQVNKPLISNVSCVYGTRKGHSDAHSEADQGGLIKSYFMYGFDYQTIWVKVFKN